MRETGEARSRLGTAWMFAYGVLVVAGGAVMSECVASEPPPEKAVYHGKSIPEWVQLLNADNAKVRKEAVNALGMIGTAAIPDVLDVLKRNDLGKFAAAEAMGKFGRPAVASLLPLLKSKNEEVVTNGVQALGEIGPDAKDAIPDLIDLMKRQKSNYRIAYPLADTFGMIGRPAAQPVLGLLREAWRTGDTVLIGESINSLGKIGPDAAISVPDLMDSYNRGNSYVRRYAAEALGRIGPKASDALPMLIRGLADDERSVRKDVSLAIGRIGVGVPEVVQPLIDMLSDSDAGVRMYASAGLVRVGKCAMPKLIESLDSRDSDVRAMAARTLGSIATNEQDAILDAVPAKLTTFLSDKNADVQREAVVALGDFGGRSKKAVRPLVDLIGGANADLQVKIATSLGKIGDPSAIRPLVDLIGGANAELQWTIATSLGEIGDPSAIEALNVLLMSTSPHVRWLASKAKARLEAVSAKTKK